MMNSHKMETLMTSPTLTKITSEQGETWATANYVLLRSQMKDDPSYGYEITNRETGQVELRIDQEPQGIMAMMWLQEQYDEIMADPEREFQRRKPRTSGLSEAPAGLRLQ
jgi:hypothetical protein